MVSLCLIWHQDSLIYFSRYVSLFVLFPWVSHHMSIFKWIFVMGILKFYKRILLGLVHYSWHMLVCMIALKIIRLVHFSCFMNCLHLIFFFFNMFSISINLYLTMILTMNNGFRVTLWSVWSSAVFNCSRRGLEMSCIKNDTYRVNIICCFATNNTSTEWSG